MEAQMGNCPCLRGQVPPWSCRVDREGTARWFWGACLHPKMRGISKHPDSDSMELKFPSFPKPSSFLGIVLLPFIPRKVSELMD